MARSFITSTLSMLSTLAIAYGIDQWIYYQFRHGKPIGNPVPQYIGEILGGLVLCVFWLTLSWIILVKIRRNSTAAIIFIVIGLLAFVWFPLEVISPFWAIHLYLFTTIPSNLQYSGLFVAALGGLTLLLPRHNPS